MVHQCVRQPRMLVGLHIGVAEGGAGQGGVGASAPELFQGLTWPHVSLQPNSS